MPVSRSGRSSAPPPTSEEFLVIYQPFGSRTYEWFCCLTWVNVAKLSQNVGNSTLFEQSWNFWTVWTVHSHKWMKWGFNLQRQLRAAEPSTAIPSHYSWLWYTLGRFSVESSLELLYDQHSSTFIKSATYQHLLTVPLNIYQKCHHQIRRKHEKTNKWNVTINDHDWSITDNEGLSTHGSTLNLSQNNRFKQQKHQQTSSGTVYGDIPCGRLFGGWWSWWCVSKDK